MLSLLIDMLSVDRVPQWPVVGHTLNVSPSDLKWSREAAGFTADTEFFSRVEVRADCEELHKKIQC